MLAYKSKATNQKYESKIQIGKYKSENINLAIQFGKYNTEKYKWKQTNKSQNAIRKIQVGKVLIGKHKSEEYNSENTHRKTCIGTYKAEHIILKVKTVK